MSEPGYKQRQAINHAKATHGRLIYAAGGRGPAGSARRDAKPKGKSAVRAAKAARRLARENVGKGVLE